MDAEVIINLIREHRRHAEGLASTSVLEVSRYGWAARATECLDLLRSIEGTSEHDELIARAHREEIDI